MSNHSNNFKGIRRNAAIRAPQVRVLDPEGEQLGIMNTQEAITLALQRYGVDLIEIAPNANPPVCRIMDFGKYKYEIAKKERDQNKVTTKLKEVKFRVRIEQNDYMTKLRHAEEFFMENNKVKLTLSFRGRELGHPELGMEVVRRAIVDLAHVATPDAEPRKSGRAINVMMSPLPTSKRKAKFTVDEEDAPAQNSAE
jgi:translation initiation factor IF-3